MEIYIGTGPDHESRITNHGRWVLRIQLTLLPGASSFSGERRMTWSPEEAARTMPWLSTPRSCAGARLATRMTLFPTSCSGAYHCLIPETTCRTSPPPMSTLSTSSLLALVWAAASTTLPTLRTTFLKSSIVIVAGAAGTGAGAGAGAGVGAGDAGSAIWISYAFERAWDRSSRISSTSSMPVERRIRPSVTPTASRSALLRYEWELRAGWVLVVVTSPRLGTSSIRRHARTNRSAALIPPRRSNESIGPSSGFTYLLGFG